MDLGAFDNIRKMQEQFKSSLSPVFRQQQMMADMFRSSDILKAQEQITRNFSALNMMSEIIKGLKQQTSFAQPTFSVYFNPKLYQYFNPKVYHFSLM